MRPGNDGHVLLVVPTLKLSANEVVFVFASGGRGNCGQGIRTNAVLAIGALWRWFYGKFLFFHSSAAGAAMGADSPLGFLARASGLRVADGMFIFRRNAGCIVGSVTRKTTRACPGYANNALKKRGSAGTEGVKEAAAQPHSVCETRQSDESF